MGNDAAVVTMPATTSIAIVEREIGVMEALVGVGYRSYLRLKLCGMLRVCVAGPRVSGGQGPRDLRTAGDI